MNNILELEKTKCVGCRSCSLVCPKTAITMTENEEGFFYPIVDENCIDCGICKKHCPILSPVEIDNTVSDCFGLILKDKKKLRKSSSGGAFAGIAESFLENTGIVYGAAFYNDLQVKHIRISEIKDLEKLQGSKYVASNIDTTFYLVKKDLIDSKKVLYSGCPCQISGLKAYLGKEYENLYTIDLVCHGTPSQKFFNEYLTWLGNRLHGKIIYYGFRDKDVSGWSCGGKFKTKTKTKTKTLIASCDPFYSSFLRGDIYRESCYSCRFANLNRVGDFTIGDLWGSKKLLPDFYRRNGVSFVLLNTKKAKDLFSNISEKFELKPCDIHNVAKYNHNLNSPTKKSNERNLIFENIKNYGYEYAFNHIKVRNYVIEFWKGVLKNLARYFLGIFEGGRKHEK